jgi:signal peptidase I
MAENYSTILFSLLAVAGVILLVEVWILKPMRAPTDGAGTVVEPLFVHYARSFFPVILAVLIVRSFVFEPFRIPSASMMPGLVDGDFIFVDKFSYGLRLPILHLKMLPIGEPQRGDVIVFRSPSNPSINLIKRLVGLPGDHIVVHDNRVSINGTIVPLSADGTYSGGFGFSGSALALEKFENAEHVVMFAGNRQATDFDGVVPPGQYFFMGDNRNDSEDSRFQKVGFVAEDNLVGHARRIWLNWRFTDWPNLRRIGMRIG